MDQNSISPACSRQNESRPPSEAKVGRRAENIKTETEIKVVVETAKKKISEQEKEEKEFFGFSRKA